MTGYKFIKEIIFKDETGSTNDDAKMLAKSGDYVGFVIAAELQTAARGRLSHSWFSERGAGLGFTIILPPDKTENLTILAGEAVCRALNEACGVGATIKFPNDILINGRKVCGILAEACYKNGAAEYAVLGIGINVNNQIFPDWIKNKATSLYLETGKKQDKRKILDRVLKSFEDEYL